MDGSKSSSSVALNVFFISCRLRLRLRDGTNKSDAENLVIDCFELVLHEDFFRSASFDTAILFYFEQQSYENCGRLRTEQK